MGGSLRMVCGRPLFEIATSTRSRSLNGSLAIRGSLRKDASSPILQVYFFSTIDPGIRLIHIHAAREQ